MASHLASLWNRGLRQLGNGLLLEREKQEPPSHLLQFWYVLMNYEIWLLNMLFPVPHWHRSHKWKSLALFSPTQSAAHLSFSAFLATYM